MEDLKGKFDEAIKERSDSYMKAISVAIIEENLREYEELKNEAEHLSVSDEFEKKKQGIIRRLEKMDKKKTRQKYLKTFGKVAAIIVLCLITTFTVLTATVEAFRFKVFDFLKIDHGKYLELVPTEAEDISEKDKAKFPGDWEGTFYPTVLPEGFHLTKVFEGGAIKLLTFTDQNEEFFNLTVIPAGESRTGIDNESEKYTEVEINGVKGNAWEKDGTCLIIWFHYEQQFELFSDSLTLPEMLKIANGIEYLKIK